ncbi:hypothetical protein [Streptomyces sp. 2224.1]|nr:hypothetical protein [Streptomyces sp. 2224.1]
MQATPASPGAPPRPFAPPLLAALRTALLVALRTARTGRIGAV